MNFKIVTDGEVGVGALVLQMAIKSDFSVSGVASPVYEASRSKADLELGLTRYEKKFKSLSHHKEKVCRLNVDAADAVILVVSKWNTFNSSLFGYTKTLEWRHVPRGNTVPAKPCLVLHCDNLLETTEDMAADISMFLRDHWPASVYICGAEDIMRRDRFVAALYAGLKSAESFR
jgi:hypothetical protein